MSHSEARKSQLVCLQDFEEAAKLQLPNAAFEYITSGAADEITVRLNREAFNQLLLRPRVLADVSTIDTRIDLFGESLPYPILLAPTAFQRAVHPEGELATAKGAKEAETVFIASTSTTIRIEDFATESNGKWWFQLYVQSNREFVEELVQLAIEQGCGAICVTVDNPVSGPRNRQQRAGFSLPEGVEPPYLRAGGDLDDINHYQCAMFTWDDLPWLRSLAAEGNVPLLLKGITHPDDAKRAVELGADGLIVSNHGGRNLDTQPATITVLPSIVDAVAGQVPLLLDGGIRRGTDVLKALALGANAVLIGRPYLYGLAVGGSNGVREVIRILQTELEMAMALTGCPDIASVTPSVLFNEQE